MKEALFERRAWDSLPLLGVGATAQVRRAGAWVVKIAHPSAAARERLQKEAALHRALLRQGFPVPELLGLRSGALVRAYVPGEPLAAGAEPPKGELLQQVWALWGRVRAFEQRQGVRLDFSPSNLFLHAGRLLLVDAGERAAPPVFRAQSPGGLREEWRAYLRQRAKPSRRVEPFWMPPSGRFHVEVPVGRPARGGRLLWANEGLARRLELPSGSGFLERLGNFSTGAPPTTSFVATRYADMIRLDRRAGPRGDGRAVYLGRVRSAAGERELTLKGCGPTPLAWRGRAFHEDGRVSFPRTLWEASVADELGRLGFDTPEYLAILHTGATTLDNTGKRWPAAAAVRVSRTHFRLGHLRLWASQPGALRAMVEHVGRELVHPRFSAGRAADLRRLSSQFARNLGADTGRTDALQIHCFNPTPGNVRLDGHFIDYSTVRFFRHYAPDFRFLEHQYGVRAHRAVWLRLTRMLVDVLEEGTLLSPEAAQRERPRAAREFERGYVDGFFSGLGLFLGWRDGHPPLPASAKRRLVRATQQLRELRGEGALDFTYWKQRCRAPLFDLAGRAPDALRALRWGHPEPWRWLLEERGTPLTPEARRAANAWVKALRPCLPIARAPARRWAEVIRPQLELESLAALCYRRSRPAQFDEWKRLAAAARHLPEGRYGYFEARARARALGHVALPTLRPGGYEVVVGLTPELLAGIRECLREVLGRRLVGALAHGSRVLERGQLVALDPRLRREMRIRGKTGVREYGPSAKESSDLDLKVFIRPGLSAQARAGLERELGARLAALPAWFPIGAHRVPFQRLIETPVARVADAFRAWNGAPRLAQLGKSPIPELQVVLLDDGGGGPAGDAARAARDAVDAFATVQGLLPLHLRALSPSRPARAQTGALHALEMVLRDEPELHPRIEVSRQGRRYRVLRGALALEACRRAGRRTVWVRLGR